MYQWQLQLPELVDAYLQYQAHGPVICEVDMAGQWHLPARTLGFKKQNIIKVPARALSLKRQTFIKCLARSLIFKGPAYIKGLAGHFSI